MPSGSAMTAAGSTRRNCRTVRTLEFHGTGQWKKVDCGYSFLPAGIVPQAIIEDLAVRYPGAKIYKAKREQGWLRDQDHGRAGADLLGRRYVRAGRIAPKENVSEPEKQKMV